MNSIALPCPAAPGSSHPASAGVVPVWAGRAREGSLFTRSASGRRVDLAASRTPTAFENLIVRPPGSPSARSNPGGGRSYSRCSMGHVIKMVPSEDMYQELVMLRNVCFPGLPLATAIAHAALHFMREKGTSSTPRVPSKGTPSTLEGYFSPGTVVALYPDPSSPSVSSPSREEGGCKGGPAAEAPLPLPVKSPTIPGGQVAMPLDDVQEFIFTLWAGTQPFDGLKDPAELYARLRLARPDLDVIEQTHRIALWWATHPKQHRKDVARFVAGWFANEGRQRTGAARPTREQARIAEIEHARSLTPEERQAEYHAMCERAGISH